MIKIISLEFDKRTKIIMCIAIIIAFCIMAYNLYNIVVKNSVVSQINPIEFYNVLEFEATYSVKVNSNKNSNTYSVVENTSYENNTSKLAFDNGITIEKNDKLVSIKDYTVSLEYSFDFDYTSKYNYVSIGDIIYLYNQINNQEVQGKIEKIEKDGNVTFKLYITDKAICLIEIKVVNSNLCEIVMYDNENNIKYYIKIDDFIVKKIK